MSCNGWLANLVERSGRRQTNESTSAFIGRFLFFFFFFFPGTSFYSVFFDGVGLSPFSSPFSYPPDRPPLSRSASRRSPIYRHYLRFQGVWSPPAHILAALRRSPPVRGRPPAGRGNSVTSASPHVRYDTTYLATRDKSQGKGDGARESAHVPSYVDSLRHRQVSVCAPVHG